MIGRKLILALGIVFLSLITLVALATEGKYMFTNFTSGVLTRKLDSRIDFEKLFSGARTLQNMAVFPYGGAFKRPGTKYVADGKDHTRQTRLIPFIFSTTQAYIIDMGHENFRFYMDEAQVDQASSALALLLHANGSDASTTFTDSGGTGHVVTAIGNAQLDTAQKKFGSASGLFDGTGDELSVPDHSDWFFGRNNFTIDAWIRFDTLPTSGNSMDVVAQREDSTHLWRFYVQNDSGTYKLGFYIIDGATDVMVLAKKTWTTPVADTWYHVAVVRGWGGDSDTYGLTVGGTAVGSYAEPDDIPNFDAPLTIGSDSTTDYFNGWIDELRVSKGVARWTANFTAPSAEYGAPSVTIYELATPYTEAQLDSLKFVQSADVLYIAHPSHVPKKLTRTAHDAWTITTISFTANPFSSADNYPATVEFHEERLCWAGTNDDPQKIWCSKSGSYEDMTTGANDDDAFAVTLAASEVNAIKWMNSGKSLLIGTTGGEWVFGPMESTTPITPSNVQIKRHTSHGSSDVNPLRIGNRILFVENNGRKLRFVEYKFDVDSYVSENLSLLAEHLTEGTTIKYLSYQEEPNSIIWAILETGDLLGLTYIEEQNVFAWHKHTTDGQFESVATIPGPNNTDQTWVSVQRDISGTKRFVEFLEELEFETLDDAFYVDSGLTYDGTPTTSLSGLDHLEGETVAVLADGSYVGTETVSSGAFTLDTAASKVQAGLPFTAILETIDLPEGTGLTRRITSIYPRFYYSAQADYGDDTDSLDPVNFTPLGSAAPYIGSLKLSMPGGWKRDQTIVFQSDEPYPFSISGIVIEYE